MERCVKESAEIEHEGRERREAKRKSSHPPENENLRAAASQRISVKSTNSPVK
jgi:hypothetical protein